MVVETQLASSMKDKVSFMAGSDVATAGLKLVNDDNAAAVVEAIKPQLGVLAELKSKIDQMSGMKEKLEEMCGGIGLLAKASEVGQQMSDHSAGMVKSFLQLSSGMESNSQILRDGILKTNDALEAFGIVEENNVDQVDIPACIKYISDMTNASSQLIGTPTRDE